MLAQHHPAQHQPIFFQISNYSNNILVLFPPFFSFPFAYLPAEVDRFYDWLLEVRPVYLSMIELNSDAIQAA